MKPDRETQWVISDYISFLPENNKKSYQFRFLNTAIEAVGVSSISTKAYLGHRNTTFSI